MSDTYARVMRASEGPADRRTTRSRAPRRPGVMRDPVAGNPAMTGVAGGAAPPGPAVRGRPGAKAAGTLRHRHGGDGQAGRGGCGVGTAGAAVRPGRPAG